MNTKPKDSNGMRMLVQRARQGNRPPLPRMVQDYLGQKLRTEYYQLGDRPAYLGDGALPISFDAYLLRLEEKERDSRARWIHDIGTQVVADALAAQGR